MDEILLNDLHFAETDVEGAIERLSGDENLYLMILSAFTKDTTMSDLETALKNEAWDEAFTAAHALKGLAGNLGFTPLFHNIAALVIVIRTGKVDEIGEYFSKVQKSYNQVIEIINKNYKKI